MSILTNTIDIGSDINDIGKVLSNFSEFHFIVDGIFCASMEGFLQSLKFEDQNKQIEVCKLIGLKAKFKGKKKKWFKKQILYWNNKTIKRDSVEYQFLLDKAFTQLFNNKEYKENLIKTKGFILTHKIGKNKIEETVLTTEEFCDRLMKLRDYN
jgi:hypothetical protein